jgi:hypothetical protein
MAQPAGVSSAATEPPNALREPAPPTAPPAQEQDVPNIFRDWPERPATTDEPPAIPNVLRDRTEQEQGEAARNGAEPPSDGLGGSQSS